MEKTKRPNTKLKDAVGEIEGKIGGYKTKSQREGEDIKVQVMPFIWRRYLAGLSN